MPNSLHNSVIPNNSAVPSSRCESTKACASLSVGVTARTPWGRGRDDLGREAVNATLEFGLRASDDALQTHGDAHVACHLELAHHEAGGGLQIAGEHGVQVFKRDADRAVGIQVDVADGVGRGFCVNANDTILAAVKFQGGVKAAVGTDFGANGFGAGFEVHGVPCEKSWHQMQGIDRGWMLSGSHDVKYRGNTYTQSG